MSTSVGCLLKELKDKETSRVSSIQSTYGDSESDTAEHLLRLTNLLEDFARCFGTSESVQIFRAPGRVNLIGEHTDYNGLPVLPIALNRDILCAASPRTDGKILIRNVDSSFQDFEFSSNEPPKPSKMGCWCNYVKAALCGLFDDGMAHGVDMSSFQGASLLYDGNVPSAAGLSSSSAMVVVSALALLGTHGASIDKSLLAQILARAEHFVGTQGGGMDQTISLLGRRDHALKIDFNPFGFQYASIPPSVRVVVTNSLVTAAKTGGARFAYNCRVIECRTACALLNRAVEAQFGKSKSVNLLGDFTSDHLGVLDTQLDSIAEGAIPKHPVHVEDVAELLSISEDDFRSGYCRLKTGEILVPPGVGFHVWERYRHVVTEGRRVEACIKALSEGDVIQVGELMYNSHSSCRDNYAISCEALDELVGLARKSKALGSRLTGAGFGGCAVSLVWADQAETFVQTMWEDYFDGYLAGKHPELRRKVEDLESVCFVVRPAEGAGLLL